MSKTEADIGLLRALRRSPHHIPRSELAERLQVSPENVAASIAELRGAGYDIEENPHLGYKLITAPDRLIADDLAGMVEGALLGSRVLVFEKTDSTNNLAARMGREGAAEGLAVFAEEQTAGRGRLGRRWESDARMGLWFSLLLRPRFSLPLWTRLTTWAAVAIAEAIEQETNRRTMIKWPNDIYVDGKKVVGILIESHFDNSGENFAVLGIGVNVNHTQFPLELQSRAASLRMACGHPLDRMQIAAAILRKLDQWYPTLEDGFHQVVTDARERSFLNGKWIQVISGKNVTEGMVTGIDSEGCLLLRLHNGDETTISSGEATISMSGRDNS